MVSIGLARAAVRRKLQVQPFKKGPDYIDPLWLGAAAGTPCYNLDPFIQNHDELEATWTQNLSGVSLALIEGTMGLHDGLCSDGSDSNAAIACTLDASVLLVVDCRGMHRTVAALINGIQLFDPDVQFAGVVLNRIRSDRHLQKIRTALQDHTDLKLLGSMPDDKSMHIDEHHLGLVPAPEHANAARYIDAVADAVEENCDLDVLFDPCPPPSQQQREVASSLADSVIHKNTASENVATEITGTGNAATALKIGVCRDAAFHFYYQDDLDYLRKSGAELVEISPLTGRFPDSLDGLLIGGGFPERHARLLADNESFRHGLCDAIANGLAVHAECAGLMYLCRSLYLQGKLYPMVGAIDGDVTILEKPPGRGYVQLLPSSGTVARVSEAAMSKTARSDSTPLAVGHAAADVICAHEFHHSQITFDHPPEFAYRVKRGYGIDGQNDGVRVAGIIASYAHFRHTNSTPWINWFLHRVRESLNQQARKLSAPRQSKVQQPLSEIQSRV